MCYNKIIEHEQNHSSTQMSLPHFKGSQNYKQTNTTKVDSIIFKFKFSKWVRWNHYELKIQTLCMQKNTNKPVSIIFNVYFQNGFACFSLKSLSTHFSEKEMIWNKNFKWMKFDT